MELELRQDYISCWDTVCDTTLNLEETSEMIVPDACPDIMQVLDGEGKVLVQRKEAQDGRAEFSGLIKANILYLPEGDEKIYCLDAVLPFSASLDVPALTRRSQIQVTPQIQNIDVHLLNPRKILLRVNFTLGLLCSKPESISLCSGVENPTQHGIQEQIEDYESHVTVAAQEKTFNYSDVLALPAGRPNMKKLLKTRADCVCNEAKIVGSKLVFKGEAQLETLYTGEDGELYHADFALPFSQILECGETGEDAEADLSLIYTDLNCKPADEEGRSLSVELELLAQAILKRQERRALLTDLYSTSYDVSTKEKEYPVSRVMDQGVAPETVRELLETDTTAVSVLDVQIRPGHLTRSRQGERLELGAEVEVCVLYGTEDGGIASVHRKFIVPHEIPVGEGWDYQAKFSLSRTPVASPVSGGIELTFTLEFFWKAVAKDGMSGIEDVTLEEPTTEPGVQSPSVVLRTVSKGDSLWKIAKEYGTTVDAIIEANDLQSTVIYPGQLLLLPKKQERAS